MPFPLRQSIRSLAIVALLCSGSAYGQDDVATQPKIVHLERVIHNAPTRPAAVQLGAAVVHQPPFRTEMAFEGGSDWLSEVQLTLRNVTDKTIVGAVVHVDFPDTDAQGRMGHQFVVGAVPERSLHTRSGEKVHVEQHPGLNVASGEPFTISLGPEFAKIKAFIETKQPVSTINSVWIRVLGVYFADGSRWNGRYEKPDPKNATGYVVADEGEFRHAMPPTQ